jgi:hypothetical protein
MSKDESASGRVYKAGEACIKGALKNGFMFGIVGFLFIPAGTPLYLFIGVSAFTGCVKEGLKTQCQSKACNALVDIGCGSLGYVLRAGAIAPALASLSWKPLVERVVVGGVNGGLYAMPSLLESPDGGNQQHLPRCNSSTKVEVSLSDVMAPLAVEGFEGAFSEYLKVILKIEPGHVPQYVESISNGVKVGSVVFACLTVASLTERLFWQAIYTDKPADDDNGLNCAQVRSVDEVSVSGDVAVIKEPDEL